MTVVVRQEHNMTRLQDEAQRICRTYAERDASGLRTLYAWHKADALYMEARKREAWSEALRITGMELLGLRVADFGCGTGEWLRMLMEWGALPERLAGFDLLPQRIDEGRRISPTNLRLEVSDCWPVPLGEGTMDFVAASVVFSSILSPEGRTELAREMLRCVRPGGFVAVYDFAVSAPDNPNTLGVGQKMTDALFSPARLVFRQSLILAPPILRRLPSSLFWTARPLETIFPFLRTHRLFVYQKTKS